MAYGRRGIGDWIPKSGEGRALVEVKGRVGMKGRRYGRGGKWSRMRRGIQRGKKPVWGIPTSPGGFLTPSTFEFQPHMHYHVGANSWNPLSPNAGANQGWLWALTPTILRRDSVFQTFPGLLFPQNGQNANGNEVGMRQIYDRVRIAGFTGKLMFTPNFPAGLNPTDGKYFPQTLCGRIVWAWYKVHASENDDASGGFTRSFPFLDFSPGDAADTADTYLPHGVNTFYDVAQRDPRMRAKLMRMGTKSWRIPVAMTYNPVGAGSYEYQCMPQPIEIPLPRNLICDVGRDEALALAYWVRDNSIVMPETEGEGGGAPDMLFNWETVRVKCYELD